MALMKKVTVIGGGAWGTALALLLAEAEEEVALWVYEEDLVDQMRRQRENVLYLPGFRLPDHLKPTSKLAEAVTGSEMIVSVVPSHVTRRVFEQHRDLIPVGVPIISATKGIENETLLPISDVLRSILPVAYHPHLAFLSGPSFAKEVALRLPTAVSIASWEPSLSKRLQKVFTRPYFKVYTNPDVLGVELGGALKNVIAIAVGCSEGLGFGHNTRAALITRGLSEITRLGEAMGAQTATFYGLSGLGDLVLTCTGELSRNRTVGYKLGQGMTLEAVLAESKAVAEGIKTTKSTYDLAQKHQVSMPIMEEVYALLYQGKSARDVARDLMLREVGDE
ncbi:MAG: NAD(P)-dependent glycerol-3-phosphate dehydrogenase [Nitrospirae bacterium]|nr:NAD(P)-dependent glycerol-3-phosphate dehydrogenase [Nitrospirota bacterium]